MPWINDTDLQRWRWVREDAPQPEPVRSFTGPKPEPVQAGPKRWHGNRWRWEEISADPAPEQAPILVRPQPQPEIQPQPQAGGIEHVQIHGDGSFVAKTRRALETAMQTDIGRENIPHLRSVTQSGQRGSGNLAVVDAQGNVQVFPEGAEEGVSEYAATLTHEAWHARHGNTAAFNDEVQANRVHGDALRALGHPWKARQRDQIAEEYRQGLRAARLPRRRSLLVDFLTM